MGRSGEEVRRRLVEIYGEEIPRDAGVLHVASAWQGPDERLWTLEIREQTPRSELDFFLLSVARARADAVVVTGKILRDEPELRYELGDPALEAWRREELGRDAPPILLVLTSGRELDPEHPALHGWARPLIYAPAEAEAALRRSLPDVVELVTHEAPDIRRAVDHLERERGCRTVSIEAGPSTSRELYAEPSRVDELMLSLFLAPGLEPGLRGGALPPLDDIEARLPLVSSPHLRDEPSGPWSFRRFTRRRG